jgi:hypothetical protein
MSGGDGMDSYTPVPAARHAWGMWPCPIILGSKCRCFLRPWCMVKSMRYWKLLGGTTECSDPSWVMEGGESGRQVLKYSLPSSTAMRKRDGADYSQVQFF